MVVPHASQTFLQSNIFISDRPRDETIIKVIALISLIINIGGQWSMFTTLVEAPSCIFTVMYLTICVFKHWIQQYACNRRYLLLDTVWTASQF